MEEDCDCNCNKVVDNRWEQKLGRAFDLFLDWGAGTRLTVQIWLMFIDLLAAAVAAAVVVVVVVDFWAGFWTGGFWIGRRREWQSKP